MFSPNDGPDSLNLYGVSGIAHYELYHAIAQADHPSGLEVTQIGLRHDLRAQLGNGTAQAKSDAFGLDNANCGMWDVLLKLFDKKDVPPDTVYDMTSLMGHYTRETIP